jgi:hypothetical protein
MKTTALAFLLVLTACGEYKPTALEGKTIPLETQKSLEVQQVSGELQNAVTSICNALAQKTLILPTAVGSSLSFQTSQSDCDGNVLAANLDVVTIQGSAQTGFTFKKATGLDFIFPDVETPRNGIFQDICNQVNNLQNPILGFADATFFKISPNCPQVSGEVCLEIEKAIIQNGVGIPHTRETIRVKIDNTTGKTGFWTFRHRLTKSFCSQDKTITLQATMN